MEIEEREELSVVERRKPRQKLITPAQYSAACKIASEVYAGRKRLTDGVADLANAQGLNAGTATDFINGYRHLCEGTVFRRTMSAAAMTHFLDQIVLEHGQATLKNAVQSLELHLKYFEGHYKRRTHGMRVVLEAFAKYVDDILSAFEVEQEFAAAVEKSLKDPSAERRRRLGLANKTAKSVWVKTRVFIRNPDVVAETLFRAGGQCEKCLDPAPFTRAKDGTPYLEVHHKMPLAKDGDDSIENAVALCPNCHREAHFGRPYFPPT